METPFNEKGVIVDGMALKPTGGILAAAPVPAKATAATPKVVAAAPAGPVDQSGFTPSGLFINSDGTINYEKSLESARQKALDLQKQASQLQQQQNTGSSSFVSSSAPVVQQEKNTTNDVKNLLGTITPPADGSASAESASDQYMAQLDTQMAALEKRRADEVARIERQFADAELGLKDTQKRETGTTSSMLARAGGYLGVSGSGTGVMLTLAQNHKSEIATLQSKRADAIQQANNAIDDKQFALAQMKVQEVKDIEKTIHDRKSQFFDDSLKAVQEARNADEFYRTKIKDDLEMLGKLAATDENFELDPVRAKAIDDFYGPGFTKQYLQVINKAWKAADAKAAIENQKSLIDLLVKIPNGEKVPFPDGTSYTGLGAAGDIYTTVETDDAGVSRLVTVDKRTKKITVSSLGKIGKANNSDGGGSPGNKALVEDNVTSELQIQLEAGKMPDNSYDPDIYIRERKDIKAAFPELVSKMDAKFLNPSNGFFTTYAIDRLRKKGVYAPTTSI